MARIIKRVGQCRITSPRARSGQVAVEWLMVAGILTAVAIVVTGIIRPVLVDMVFMLAGSMRTIGL